MNIMKMILIIKVKFNTAKELMNAKNKRIITINKIHLMTTNNGNAKMKIINNAKKNNMIGNMNIF